MDLEETPNVKNEVLFVPVLLELLATRQMVNLHRLGIILGSNQ